MDKLTAIKIKYDDGTYSDEIPVSVLSENVEWDSTHTLVDILGSIDIDTTGTIQDQISQLFNAKADESDVTGLQSRVTLLENNPIVSQEAIENIVSAYMDDNSNIMTDEEAVEYFGEDAASSESDYNFNLNRLSDVTIFSPSNGQILQYDATNEAWVNNDNPQSGGGAITSEKIADKAVSPDKTTFLDEYVTEYSFDQIYAKGYLVTNINTVLYNKVYDRKTTILVELNGGDCSVSASYANGFTYAWIDEFINGQNVTVVEAGEKTLEAEENDYSMTIKNTNNHKYLIGSFGTDQSKPPKNVKVKVFSGTYETGDLITGLKSPDIVNSKNIKASAVTNEKLADDSVTSEKITNRAVTAEKTSFWPYDKINIIENAKPLDKTVIPYVVTKKNIFGGSYNIFEFSKTGYVVKLLPGIEYLPVIDVNGSVSVSFYTTDKIATEEECNTFSEDQYSELESAGFDTTKIRYTTGEKFNKVGINSWACPQRFTVESECYMYLSDKADVYAWEDIDWLKQYTSYTEAFKLFGSSKIFFDNPIEFDTTSHKIGNPIYFEDFKPSDRLQRLIRRTNYIDALKYSTLSIAFIGDSITAAASNAGLQRAFRKQVRYKLHLNYQNDLAVNGTCITNGCGTAWDNQNRTGINGILENATYLTNVPDDPKTKPNIFIIALGTNDFGNNASLGDVESEDRETTFAGCYLKLIETIRENYPESHIICMCPLDRQTAKTENTAGCTLLDYVRVIYEIVSITEHTWILDLSNNPIINYENYPEAYIDAIHVNKYAHAVITDHLCDLILRIVSVAGFDYIS